MDDAGTVWHANREAGLRAFPLQGFDAFGNPVYTVETSVLTPSPPPFDDPDDGDISRLIYLPAEDTMILSGYTRAHPNPAQDWGPIGTVIQIYENWSGGTADAHQPEREIVLPYDVETRPRALALAGDFLFVGYLYGAKIEVFNRHSGTYVGALQPDETVGSISGWLDLP